MDNYPDKLKQFLETLDFLDGSQRIQMLVDYADKYKPVPPEIAGKPPYPQENKVPFCESGAYVWTVLQDNNIPKFYFAVENLYGVSAKALSVILDKTLSGETADKILNISPDVIYKIFGTELSMGKNLGLTGIILKMQNDVKRLIHDKSNTA